MDDKTVLKLLEHYSPRMAAEMRKKTADVALLESVAANPDGILVEPCRTVLEGADVVACWELAVWFVGISPARGMTQEWSRGYALNVGGEVGSRLTRAVKICRACQHLWAADEVLVAEFIRRLPEMGLEMPTSGPVSNPETVTVVSDAPGRGLGASRVLKRAALVLEVERDWPTVRADLDEASRNGLSAAAKRPGGWDVDAARLWAGSKGKLRRAGALAAESATWHGAVTRHVMRG